MTSRKVFISSVFKGLSDVREKIYNWASKNGYDAWVFEESDPLLGKTPPVNIERVCLHHVDDSALYIVIFHTGYGSSAKFHLANISLVDIEFFEAFKEGKPIYVYILKPFTPVRELEVFVEIVKTLLPNSVKSCENEHDLVENIQRDIEQHFSIRKNVRKINRIPYQRRYLAKIAAMRRPLDIGVGLRFNGGEFPQLSGRDFDRESVQSELRELTLVKDYTQVLDNAWKIIEKLFDVPWNKKEYHEHLPLWNEVLSLWDTASAWCGLHGALLIGKLAADNTLLAVRSRLVAHGEEYTLNNFLNENRPKTGTVEEWINLYSLGCALASEYYSIAKQASSKRNREYYLKRSDSWLRVAERATDIDDSLKRKASIAAIRGHVYQMLGNLLDAEKQFKFNLQIREDNELIFGSGEIGEARSDLGYIYHLRGQNMNAEKLLVEGVKLLEGKMDAGFAVRAKKKLASYYLSIGNFHESVRQFAESEALREKYRITGQYEYEMLSRFVQLLGPKIWTELDSLKAVEGANGYEYRSRT